MKQFIISLIFICLIFSHQTLAQVQPGSIVGIWLFDEGNGDISEDLSGNGNDAEIVDAKWADGKNGTGLEFDGTNHVRIPASQTTDDFIDGFTYLLWLKPLTVPSNPNTRVIERDWHNPTIQIGATDFYGSIVFNGVIDNSQIRGGSHVVDEWSFVALAFDGTNLYLYANGEMANEIKAGKPELTSTHDGGSIWLARWKEAAGWDFSGVIDEVGIFNVALSLDEINEIMNNGLQPAAISPADKLASIWGFIKQ